MAPAAGSGRQRSGNPRLDIEHWQITSQAAERFMRSARHQPRCLHFLTEALGCAGSKARDLDSDIPDFAQAAKNSA